ncbi:hypothetical protein BC833DRAFT_561565 [Globomyces pollinis-pini]|nr:hypothetical protein BC833DRAFT_561565 [Globomyces pollinis-pini]
MGDESIKKEVPITWLQTVKTFHTPLRQACTRIKAVMSQPYVDIEEQLIVTKARWGPAGSKNKNSTTGNRSHHEYVAGPKCGICKQSGHNSQTRKAISRMVANVDRLCETFALTINIISLFILSFRLFHNQNLARVELILRENIATMIP